MAHNPIFALFPPGNRGAILQQVLEGNNVFERYMLYGIDRMILNGLPVRTYFSCKENFLYFKLLNGLYKFFAKYTIGSHGDLLWMAPAFPDLWKNGVVFAFSEKCIYPLLFLRFFGLFKNLKVILISIGLSEKFQLLVDRGASAPLNRLLSEIESISKIITFSWSEKTILTNNYNLDNVVFIPLGVDVDIFKSTNNCFPKKHNIISVGADKNRDFDLLVKVAQRMPDLNFLLITNDSHASVLQKIGIPKNIELKVDVPMCDVYDSINLSEIVFLPVKENFYSGATTCLLQAMSLSKPVVTCNVGPISDGYGLVDNENEIYVKPQDIDGAISVISNLLSDMDFQMLIGENARRHVEKFLTLDKMIDSINQIVLSEMIDSSI